MNSWLAINSGRHYLSRYTISIMNRKTWLTALLALPLFIVSAHNAFAQSDSLLAAYRAATTPEAKAIAAYKITAELPDSKAEVYVVYARQGLAAVRNLEVAVKAKLANVIGYYHQQIKGAYDSAIFYYSLALETAKYLKSGDLISTMTGNLGEVYTLKGNFPKALNYELTALNYYETKKESADVQRLNIQVGNTYYHMADYRRALSYYNRVYPALKDAKTYKAGGLFNSMALTYKELGEMDKVTPMQQKALAIHRALGDSLAIANTLNNLGSTAVTNCDYAAAEKYFKDALGIALALGNTVLIDEERQNIATLQAKSGNTTAAIEQFKISAMQAKASGDARLQKAALQSLVAIYDSLRDYNRANRYMAEYQQLADTTGTVTYQHEIADAETRYETQRVLRERDRLFYESSLQSAARARAIRERNTAIAIGGGSVAALALIFFLALRIRSIRAKTKEEQRATRALFEGEQAERIRIARDLHDSIGQMLAVVKMRLTSQPNNEAENKTIISGLIDKTIDEVRAISHNLIPEDLTFGTVRALENLCARMAENSGIAVQLSVAEAVRAYRFNQEFGLSLYRIVQEVLGNMMKHSGASAISLNMAQSASSIIMQIADNGKGFDTGTIGASKGIGWKNIYARVGLLNGSVDVRSERIYGTRIQISIPQ